MASRTSAPAKSSAQRKSAVKKPSAAKASPGKLPEWNLADLYSGIDAPEVVRDLDRMDVEWIGFEQDYKGKLAEETAKEGGGAWLAAAVKRFEAIDDLAGRLSSYAGLVHAGDSVDPAISKFYGDVSERLTAASVHLLFFGLELNRVDDAVIERAVVCAGHQYARQGQGNIRPLARFRRCCGFAASRQPRRTRGGGCAGGVGARGLSAAVAPLLRIEGKLVQKEETRALGPQCAA